jgi:hypothetical protein
MPCSHTLSTERESVRGGHTDTLAGDTLRSVRERRGHRETPDADQAPRAFSLSVRRRRWPRSVEVVELFQGRDASTGAAPVGPFPLKALVSKITGRGRLMMEPSSITDLDLTLRVTAGARAWLRGDRVALYVLTVDLDPEMADAFLITMCRIAARGAWIRGVEKVFCVHGVDIGEVHDDG